MEAWVTAKASEGGDTIFVVGFVEEGAADFFKVELEFFGEDVFDEGFHTDVIVAADGGEVGVCTGAFGEEVLVPGVCCCGVLRD